VHPWRVVTAWGLILAASVVAIGALIGSAFTSDGSITTNPDSTRAAQVLADNFSKADRIDDAIIIHSAQLTSQDPEFRGFVTDVRSSIESTNAAQTVRDPYAHNESGISEDGHAAVITLVLGHDAEAGIVKIIDQVRAADADAAFDVDITGTNTLDHDFTKLSESDLTNGELKFGLPAALLVLVLVVGALVAAFRPMCFAIISIFVTVAISSALGQVTSLSFFIINMITAMGLALGIDYSLFVLSRYREERQGGRDKIGAIVATGGTSSKAVLFSGSSFVVALLGLLLVPDTILRSLALGAIIVGVVTMAAAVTLLPALLSLLGDRVNALRLPFVGRDHPAESPFWTRAVSAVVRRPATFLAVGVLVLLAAAAPVLGLTTGTAGVNSLPDSTYSKAGALALERNFPGAATTDPAQVVISGDITSADVMTAIERFGASIADDPDFGPAEQQLSDNGRVAVISVPLIGDPDHSQARRGLDRLRTDLVPAAFDGTDSSVLVGGTTAQNVDYSDVINKWLPLVLAFVLGLSFLLLTLVFRSLVLAATAVVLNLLSVGAAYGLLVLVFQHGIGADLLGLQRVERVEAWVPIFLFSVLFALSMDYHVFLLSRIRERYAETNDTNQAVVHGIAATGRIITGAALIIVVVFGGFAAGQLVMFQQMGFGVGIALLLDATLIRMVVVPAAMALLGRWNWYLPTWLDWLPELHVEGDAPHDPPEAQASPPALPPPVPVPL
jgi:RND superfamily putative drug exporter